jgi:hypothetical protein
MTSDRRKSSAGDAASKRVRPQRPPVGKRSSTDPYGTDLAVKVKKEGRGQLAVSYWDLWMILLADQEFDADLDRLAAEMRAQKDRFNPIGFGREEWKARLSHLRDLQQRLRAGGLDLAAVIEAAGPLAQQEARRARRKVMEKPARQAEWSEPMQWTPQKKGFELALHG